MPPRRALTEVQSQVAAQAVAAGRAGSRRPRRCAPARAEPQRHLQHQPKLSFVRLPGLRDCQVIIGCKPRSEVEQHASRLCKLAEDMLNNAARCSCVSLYSPGRRP